MTLHRSIPVIFPAMLGLILLTIQTTMAADPPAQKGIVRSELIFEEPPVPECHASTIEETPTGLVAAWFAGTTEGNSDVGIWVSRLEKGTWTAPHQVAEGVEQGKRHPCWNPVLFQEPNGRLLLFYKVGPSPSTWWGRVMDSTDGGKTWSASRKLPDGILGPIKNKPVLVEGRLLCGSSTEHDGWRVHVETTPDMGKTWSKTEPLNDGKTLEAIQPTILNYGPRRLQMLCRGKGTGKIVESWSDDGGKTWGPLAKIDLPNPNSGLDAVTLKDGRQLLVYNHTPRGRSPLNVAISSDGKQWQAALVLENTPGEYSYPAVIATQDGLVHITYTWKRQRIRHVVVDPKACELKPIENGIWPGAKPSGSSGAAEKKRETPEASVAAAESTVDVLVYGGTSGGIAAAIQVARQGKKAMIVEPGKHLGGLTSGGLGATDIGNKGAIGGISREFYRRVKLHYDQDSSWKFEARSQYRSPRQTQGEDTMWTFEPQVAEKIFADMLREASIPVVFRERLDLKQGVQKTDNRIVAIRTESGKTYRAKYFIDATYEGDLMALAKVSYHVGREANSVYDETLNGVQTRNAVYHQMVRGVDPYREKGNPESGLLPGVHAGPPGEEGSGDRRVQAYNFRMCLTDVEANRVPFEKPEGYDPLRYELLLRNFEAGEKRTPWSPTLMPNRKTDVNNNHGFSTDNINMNYEWADGDYAARDKIFQEHLLYQRGLMWTLANDPRVPENIRAEVSKWGNCKDEFPEFGGWSHQLYVREARRMVSDYVMTQHNCQGKVTAQDSVGLAAYTMDSHNVQRYVDEKGEVRNEGDVQVGGFPPYPISYRSLVPKESECANLLVPVCLAASHIAYGSIRMEPVFMVLGQSSASAACQALDDGVSVQRVDYARLRSRLLEDKQVLEWTGPRPQPVNRLEIASLPGIVLDDTDLEFVGEWTPSSSAGGFVGRHYWHDNHENPGQKSARFLATLKAEGRYEVRLAYTPHTNRATNVTVTVQHADGATGRTINQQQKPPIDGSFISLGEFSFRAGAKQPVVVISNGDADGFVIVDAVQLLEKK